MVLSWFVRVAHCATSTAFEKDQIVTLSESEHAQPLNHRHQWLEPFKERIRPMGPRFPNGSINWQCGCMAGGSLAAHRCGFFFRRLYLCMSSLEDDEDATVRCPEQFVNWAACMQNMDEDSTRAMKERFLAEAEVGEKGNREKEKKTES